MLKKFILFGLISAIAGPAFARGIVERQILIPVKIIECKDVDEFSLNALKDIISTVPAPGIGQAPQPSAVVRGCGEVGVSSYGDFTGSVDMSVTLPLYGRYGMFLGAKGNITLDWVDIRLTPTIATQLGNGMASIGIPAPAAESHIRDLSFSNSMFWGREFSLDDSFVGWNMYNETLLGARYDTQIGDYDASISVHTDTVLATPFISAGVSGKLGDYRVGMAVETDLEETYFFGNLFGNIGKFDVSLTGVTDGDGGALLAHFGYPVTDRITVNVDANKNLAGSGAIFGLGGTYQIDDRTAVGAGWIGGDFGGDDLLFINLIRSFGKRPADERELVFLVTPQIIKDQ